MQKRKRNASSTLYIIIFFITFLAFAAFAVDGTLTWTNRMKLQNATESAALAAAGEFYKYSSGNSALVETNARDTFNNLKADILGGINTSDTNKFKVSANPATRTVCISVDMPSPTFFLSFLGVNSVGLKSNACAVSEELDIKASYAGINWLTVNAAYLSDILSKDLNYNDTAILTPIGNFVNSQSIDATTNYVDFSRINYGDNLSLSLGAGGFITIKLPAPIIDKPGNDLMIEEAGDANEGYMVFAGIDVDPDKPYVRHGEEGSGIVWVNITNAGTSVNSDMSTLAFDMESTGSMGFQYRIFGSGYFDIAKKGLSMVKYIRIVDDNEESAVFKTTAPSGNVTYKKVKLLGEASTSTPGADIDYVKVLNHVRLVPSTGG